MKSLRFALWHGLLTFRGPIQFVLRLLSGLCLLASVAAIIMLFVGRGSASYEQIPFLAKAGAVLFTYGLFYLLGRLSYAYDSLIFRVTPADRNISLFD